MVLKEHADLFAITLSYELRNALTYIGNGCFRLRLIIS